MKMTSLNDLFLHELRDLYGAEQQLLKALPKMAKAAASEKLRDAFTEHTEQTREQIGRLEEVFNQLGEPMKSRKCEGMEGIIKEGEEILSQNLEPAVKDAALICAAQKAEHYEMASYGTARTFARILGHNDAASIFEQTLGEEKKTDKLLSQLAERGGINKEARQP